MERDVISKAESVSSAQYLFRSQPHDVKRQKEINN